MIHYRTYRNTDSPALASLWNAAVPGPSSARPLRVHELDDHAFNSVHFDRSGLIVAEREGRTVGFVHAGFGPADEAGARPFQLDLTMGSIVMLAVEPGAEEAEIAAALVVEAERYLRRSGAKVVYGGGRLPVNPFYWGVYGGSESAGVPSGHYQFSSTLSALGYEPVSTAVHLQFDLERPDARDPRTAVLRRQFTVEFQEDARPSTWWENIALGDFQPVLVRLLRLEDQTEVAQAKSWDMTWFSREDGRPRIGVFDVQVAPEHRRRGYGRFLMGEIFRDARERGFAAVEVQTLVENEPALAMYQSLDFEPVDQSTLFRLPAPFSDRSRPNTD